MDPFAFDDVKDVRPAEIATGGRVSFMDGLLAGREVQAELNNTISYSSAISRAQGQRRGLIRELTGIDIDAEIREAGAQVVGPAPEQGGAVGISGLTANDRYQAEILSAGLAALGEDYYERRVDDIRGLRPDVADQIPTLDDVEAKVSKDAQDLEARQAELMGRSGRAGQFGAFTGAVIGAFQDPLNIATLPVGGGGRTILGAATRTAGANVAIETAVQPFVQQGRANFGVEAGFGQGVSNVLYAGVGGGVLGGGAKSLDVAFNAGVSRLDLRAEAKALQETAPDAPIAQAAARMVKSEDDLDLTSPFEDSAAGTQAHREAIAAISRAETLPETPNVAVRANERPIMQGLSVFRPKDLQVDAKRFQFKSGGDAAGVTDRLRDVKKWDPLKASDIMVWVNKDGAAFVADGHQRTGLAKRLEAGGQEIEMLARVTRETDGITADDARAIAAAKNLSQGTGTAIDAAKVLRVNPELLDGTISLSGSNVRQGSDMMRLDDESFMMIVNEVIPPHYGAVIGRVAGDRPELHKALVQLISETKPDNMFQTESIIRQAIAGPVRKEVQEGLFGTEEFVRALFKERAKVLDTAVKRLRKNQSVFKTLINEDGRISAAGNKLDKSANESKVKTDAEVETLISQLATRKGPVSDALNSAAEQLAAGASLAAVSREFADSVGRQLERDGLAGISSARGVTRTDDVGATAGRADGGTRGDTQNRAEGGEPETDGLDRPISSDEGLDENTLSMFDEPLGTGAQKQLADVEADLKAAPPADEDLIPMGVSLDESGNPVVQSMTAKEAEDMFAQNDKMLNRLRDCAT